MTFTVVIPAYNAGRFIAGAIGSVLRQTIDDFEIVVVDDGSTDDTLERVATFASDTRIRLARQEQRGPSAARNRGIELARGELVSMLDADDLWLPQYLEQMRRAFERDPDAGFAYTDAWVLNDEGKVRRKTAMAYQQPPAEPPRDPRLLMLELARRNFVYTAATVKRSVLTEVGGYDERFRHGEDLELWLRIASNGYRAARAEGILAIHRDHSGSLTSDTEGMLTRAVSLYETIASEHRDADVRAIATGQAAALSRLLERHRDRSIVGAAWRLALRTRARLLAGRRWLDEAPSAVAETLAAVRR
jgi:GT2 family glycosyltransferase